MFVEHGAEFVQPEVIGRIRREVGYLGGSNEAIERLSKDADLLVSEMIDLASTMANVGRNSPNMSPAAKANLKQHLSTLHLTPDEVCKLAVNAGVKSLVITHFAADTPDLVRTKSYVAQIGAHFSGAVALANDLDRF